MAPGLGIEPRLTESKSVVLPLHNPGIEKKLPGDAMRTSLRAYYGAGDRGRTDDNHVGNVALYQLSYTRIKDVSKRL